MDLHKRYKQKPRRPARITSVLFLSHPFVCLAYYSGILLLIFSFNHPAFIVSAFIMIFLQISYLMSLRAAVSHLKIYLVLGLAIALLNPLFNRRGVTILFYLFDKPVTLESFAYGLYMMLLILTMLMVFVSINNVLGMSKLLYLFSSPIPQTGFIISMTLRYGELFKRQAREYMGIQTTRANSGKTGKFWRIKNTSHILAGFFSSSLEDGMIVSETLKAKEYGKHQRSHYQKYKMRGLDFVFMSIFLSLGALLVVGKYYDLGNIDYYNNLHINLQEGVIIYVIYLTFFLLPLIIDGFYAIKRKCSL